MNRSTATTCNSNRGQAARTPRLPALVLALCLAALAGCAPTVIDNTYGKRRGVEGGLSVNGTAVLADMFQRAGYKVNGWRRLSPRLERSQVIVWATESFEPPTQEQREFLENWLKNESGRTLIFIGRDFDALPLYWTKVLPTTPPEQTSEVLRRRAQSLAAHDWLRVEMPQEQDARWFIVRRDGALRQVRTLQGPWAEGIDAKKVEIEIEGRLDPMKVSEIPLNAKGNPEYKLPKSNNVLLESDGDVLVSEISDDWYGSKIIVVANGSFLLNLPLVNHEHRKLAGRLIAACGEPGVATFVEAGPLGLQVYNHDPSSETQSGLEWLIVWPLGAILLHILSFGILLCFALYPIFGRPRRLESPPPGDFGRHIGALGELMEQTSDEAYALARLDYYHQHVKRDSGASSLDRRRSGAAHATRVIALPSTQPNPYSADSSQSSAARPATGQ